MESNVSINQQLVDKTAEQLRNVFPIDTPSKRLEIVGKITVDVNKDIYTDIPAQKETKIKRKSWTVPLRAKLRIIDKKTGQVISEKMTKLVDVPMMTNRYSFIIDGNEYSSMYQWRLNPGVYTRLTRDGFYESTFNLALARLTLRLDPESLLFYLTVEETSEKFYLYPILRTYGKTDREMQEVWGKAIFEKNRAIGLTFEQQTIIGLAKKVAKVDPDRTTAVTFEEAKELIQKYFEGTHLDAKVVSITVGVDSDKINAEVLLATSAKLLKVMRGEAPEDERDSLAFKDIYNVADRVEYYLDRNLKTAKRKLEFKLRNRVDVADIVTPDIFPKIYKNAFLKDDLISPNPQTNPMEMQIEARKTTVMGPGGIQSAHAITEDVRNIHPSHIGILDPLQTPEGKKVGVTVPLSVYTEKRGKKVTTAYLRPDGTEVFLSPLDTFAMTIGFPGQYKLVNGKPIPIADKIKGYRKGVAGYYPGNEVDVYLKGAYQLWSLGSSIVPFLNSNSGNRAAMAGRQMTQAVQLVNPEAPLVLVKDPVSGKPWNELFGNALNITPHSDFTTGEVTKIDKDYIFVKEDKTKKVHKLGLYDNFPLNQESFLQSTPIVKVGDKIDKHTVLAKNNFQDDSLALALGKNVNVAYMPWKGLNVEDATVVTETAAKEMFASESIQKETLVYDHKVILDLQKFRGLFPEKISADKLSMYDEDGIVKQGSILHKDDLVIAAAREKEFTQEQVALNKLNKKLAKPFVDISVPWNSDEPGEVVYVNKGSKRVDVHIKMVSPLEVGDKLAGVFGNKLVVSKIIPDDAAPHTKDGRSADLIMNPFGVIGRTNIGQLLTTAAGKIALKTGKPYLITNFENENNVTAVMDDLKKYGVEPDEVMTDGVGGKEFERKIFFGPQYIMKLKHMVDHKIKTRSYGSYDINEQVTKGEHGGQSIDPLQWYALTAHGLKQNMAETTKYLNVKNDEFWRAIQLGLPIPKPTKNFVWDKFASHLRGSGIDLRRDGNLIKMLPTTDKDLLSISGGEIKEPRFIIGKNLAEIKGGLFDPEITGGHAGEKYSHMTLLERIPNPVYEETIQKLMGYTKSKYNTELMDGTLFNNVNSYLKHLDVDDKLKELGTKMKTARAADISKINYQTRVLRNLKQLKIDPYDAFTMKYLPVIPPKFRPIYPLPNGDLNASPINFHYRDVGLINNELKSAKAIGVDTADTKKAKGQLYLAVKAAQGLGDPVTYENRKEGLLKTLAGDDPGSGFIQGKLWRKRRDLSGRSVATVNPQLGLDEIGIPNEMLWDIYRPFIIRELIKTGMTPAVAAKHYKDRTEFADRALNQALDSRPIFLNRAPSLHKHSVMAFKPRRTNESSIQTNPLILKGLNLDYDGDCVSTYITTTYSILILVKMIEKEKNIIIDKTLDFDSFYSYICSMKVNYKLIEGVEMLKQAYVTYLDTRTDSTFNIHIKDFPHTGIVTKENDKVTEYEVPDYIKTYALDNGKIILCPVSRFSIHKNLQMFKVKTSSARDVVASSDHSLICYNPNTGLMDKIKPQEALGLLTPIPASLPMSDTNKRTFDFGWLVGAYVGDSWVNGEGTNNFNGHKNQIMLANVSVPTIEKFGEVLDSKGYTISNTHTFDGHECHSTKTTWLNADFADYFRKNIGHMAANKNIPRDFLTWGKQALYGVISGLIDTDGSISISNGKSKPQYMANYTTISNELRYQVQQLFATVGVRTSVTPYQRNGHAAYTISISMVDLIKIRKHLRLTVVGKQKLLTEATVSRDHKDIVPITFSLAKRFQVLLGMDCGVLYTTLSKSSRLGIISRNSAIDALSLVDGLLNKYHEWLKNTTFDSNYFAGVLAKISFPARVGPEAAGEFLSKLSECKDYFRIFRILEKINSLGTIRMVDAKAILGEDLDLSGIESWRNDIVLNNDLYWDSIQSVDPDSETTGYDLTVPGPYVFMTSNLMTVQDTVTIYPPVTTEAVEEAWGALPSRNPYKSGTRSVIHGHTWDYIVGLYYATKKGKNTNLKFANIEDARLHKPALKYNDVFMLNGKEMTLGLWETNDPLPPALRDYDTPIDATVYYDLLEKLVDKYPNNFEDVINKWKDIGYQTAFVRGQTLSITDMAMDRTYRDKVVGAAVKLGQKDPSRLVELMAGAEKLVEVDQDKQMQHNKNNAWDFKESKALRGAKGKNITQVLSMVGMVADLKGNPIMVPITHSWAEGQDPFDYWSSLYGARKGSVDKSINTADTGYLNKVLLNNTARIVVTEDDCGTDKFIRETEIEPIHLIGRVLALDVPTVGKKGDVITQKEFNAIKQKHLTMIPIRSILTCEAKDNGVCQLCYGWLTTNKFPSIGENVGVSDSQSITEPLTQATLQVFHQGGKLGAVNASQGYDRADEILRLKQNPVGIGTLSQVSGTVDSIIPNPAGGFNVTVNDTQHYVPVGRELQVKKGMFVNAGDPISNGVYRPQEIAALKGIDAARSYMVKELQGTFMNPKDIMKKSVETVVKGITDRIIITDPKNDKEYLKGDITFENQVNRTNRERKEDGLEPIEFKPYLQNIDILPLTTNDWGEMVGARNIKKVITQSAALGRSSNIHGTHPLPGYMYALEYGQGPYY